MTRGISSYKQLRLVSLGIVALLPCFSLAPIRCLADPPGTIYLYEGGNTVDESAYYSYSEEHLISAATQQIVGTASGSATPVMDANNNIIGYQQTLVDNDNNVIGYRWFSSAPPM